MQIAWVVLILTLDKLLMSLQKTRHIVKLILINQHIKKCATIKPKLNMKMKLTMPLTIIMLVKELGISALKQNGFRSGI